MKILGIETSSPLFSLCICEDETTLYEVRKNRLMDETSRDAHFFDEAKTLIDSFGSKALGAIAVSIGPGMFTSLRVGLSLAKGIAFAHAIPIVAVNTLDIIGSSLSFLPHDVLAVINAYHEEIYAALYRSGTRTTDYLLTTPRAVLKLLKAKTFVVGSGLEMFGKSLSRKKNVIVLNDSSLLPSAAKVVTMALPRIRSHAFDESDGLEPFYIKKTDAERYFDKTSKVR